MNTHTLLLVDDDPSVRGSLKNALEKEYRVLEASRYSEALRMLRYPISLAIIDYVLPDNTGLEALAALRVTDPSMPAIIMTVQNDKEIPPGSAQKDFTEFMRKPVSLSSLRMKLHTILSDDGMPLRHAYEGSKELVFSAIVKHIEDRYMQDISLDTLAGLARMSKFSVCRAFKKRFGQTFITYLNSIRIRNAEKHLKNTRYSIREIAYFVGYRNTAHFNRVFKAAHKVSPREYRKQAVFLHQNKHLQEESAVKKGSSDCRTIQWENIAHTDTGDKYGTKDTHN
ncbi:MAG: response regulator transcription factor [Nitrospirota bacterium]